jgi:ribosomal protein S4E
MDEQRKFGYGDSVVVTKGQHSGRLGAVVSLNGTALLPTYTVEFGDGTDAELDEDAIKGAEARNLR